MKQIILGYRGLVVLEGKLGHLDIGDNHPVRVMAVLNVSPESFYKGSVFTKPEEIKEFVEKAVNEGCDLIDIGGRSTAPYLQTEIPIDVEIERVVKAIRIVKDLVDIPISIDTFRSRVAEEALKAGADIVNDVTGLKGDRMMINVVRDYRPSLIICAREIVPRNGYRPVERVIAALEESLGLLRDIDYDMKKVAIDPCIGFFRYKDPPWYIWDLSVLSNLDRLRVFGLPIVIGVSRKSFIGVLTGKDKPEERLYGSLAFTAIAILKGAHVIRTHDVAATRDVIRAIEGFKKYGIELHIKYP
ncbi:MAG: dihydropteroate synthase [Desulfurococcaceae archaeon]